ncbi:MAG: DegQ family serine endoprotease [Hydrocarboniphaga effusa]|nr:DegQ family serine endoprotease [Hydrocarboniphaga effusa]
MKRLVAPSILLSVLLAAAPFAVRAEIPSAMLGSSATLAPMLKEAMPAVVNISVTSKAEMQNPLMQDPFFRHFFELPDQPQPQDREPQAIGSGVIVDAVKGYVLTNHHVIEQADKIRVRLTDDRELSAKLIGSDPDSDIAVLQITPDKTLKALPFADSDKLQIGDFAVAIGNPFGIGQTVTSGIVSALGRTGLGAGRGGYENFVQTDASINPGNSGGPLVNLKGELIGINSQIVSRTGTSAGIGFAIPSNQARFVLTQIIEHGSVQRGRIGVGGQDITAELAKAFGLPAARGAVISQVVPGSPAAKAGLKAEDIILEANGKELRSFYQLRNMLGLMQVGEKVDLKVLRDGKPRMVSVTIGKDTEQAAAGAKLHPRLTGATFAPVDESNAPDESDARGIVVQRVQPRSPAARLGLRENDIIIGVNRKRVETMAEFEKLAGADQEELLLHVRRGNNAFFIVVN